MLCGLEIHQRLEGKKLFNSCQALMPSNKIGEHLKFFRRLNSAFSELGELDKAAAFESQKDKTFYYLAPYSSTCLVDTDEEPPGYINKNALIYALSLSKFLGSHIVDEIYVMRKIIIDGSNVSGFQRTALIAVDGMLKENGIEIPIHTICLEEESAGIIEQTDKSDLYRLDRLGIPLIEISTKPVFKSASDAKKAAIAIGSTLRMMPFTMRGLGSIRQDVNVSVDGGERVEIKGLQNIQMLELLINNEEKRQLQLIEIINEIKKRKIDFSKIEFKDVSNIFIASQCKIFSETLKNNGVIYAIKIPKFFGLLGKELYSNKRFGSEISDYAKIYSGVKGIIHSDENLEKYKISKEEIENLSNFLQLEKEDSFILIAEQKEKVIKAVNAAINRIKMDFVPSETRKANEDGSSSFLRPIAGAARLYPETDLKPIDPRIFLSQVFKIIPFGQRLMQYKKLIGKELALQIVASHNLFLFEEFLQLGLDPKQSVLVLEKYLTEFKREGLNTEKLTKDILIQALRLYSDKKINHFALAELLRQALILNTFDLEKIAKEKNLYQLSKKETKKLFEQEGDIKKFMQKYRLIADLSIFKN
ncbi:MAG: Glu-tRNA(Gln) amidotransferase subunit GatE [Candidatus Anstonellaceae archaeon]